MDIITEEKYIASEARIVESKSSPWNREQSTHWRVSCPKGVQSQQWTYSKLSKPIVTKVRSNDQMGYKWPRTEPAKNSTTIIQRQKGQRYSYGHTLTGSKSDKVRHPRHIRTMEEFIHINHVPLSQGLISSLLPVTCGMRAYLFINKKLDHVKW